MDIETRSQLILECQIVKAKPTLPLGDNDNGYL